MIFILKNYNPKKIVFNGSSILTLKYILETNINVVCYNIQFTRCKNMWVRRNKILQHYKKIYT
jgi:hypothetical protein